MVTPLRSQAYLVSPSHPSKICLPLWGTGKCQEMALEREQEERERERESKVWELQGGRHCGQERKRREKRLEGSQSWEESGIRESVQGGGTEQPQKPPPKCP